MRNAHRSSSLKSAGLFSLAWLLLLAIAPAARAVTHPFLVCTSADFSALQAKAATEPWATYKTNAINNSNAGYATVSGKAYRYVWRKLGASALAYILDPTHKLDHKDRVVEGIMVHLDQLDLGDAYNGDGHDFGGSVITVAIVAMDIVYNDMTTQERADCQAKIQSKVDLIAPVFSSGTSYNVHPLCRGAMHSVWDTFLGVAAPNAVEDYRYVNNDYFTEDGVFDAGIGYAVSQYSDESRPADSMSMDILSLCGRDNYYTDAKYKKAFEWVYGYTHNPSRKLITFGDTDTRDISDSTATAGTGIVASTSILRAGRFGATAAGSAAWLNFDPWTGLPRQAAYGQILGYIIPTAVLPTPVKPQSRIFPNGGAWFWENNPSDNSLMGAMWNTKSEDDHSHKDINALYLAGYGEHLLVNSGYAGFFNGAGGSTWTWIHDTDQANNTVNTSSDSQVTKHGNGIIEGFTGGLLDYACGDAGPALANDTHYRNFVMIHPQDGANGYWAVFDEVNADAGEKVNTFFHPNTRSTTGITDLGNGAYDALIDGLTYNGNEGPYPTIAEYHPSDAWLRIVYGTAPATVTPLSAGFGCSWSGAGLTLKYLQAQYNTDANGDVNVATILFPHDATHAAGSFSRITATGCTGTSVTQGSVVDYALASTGTANVTVSGATFNGKATVFRQSGGQPLFWFVRKGATFDSGTTPRHGFDVVTGSPVSLYLRQDAGQIVSTGGQVKFYYPSISGVKIDGAAQSVVASGAGWVTINVTAGTHAVQYVLNQTVTLTTAMGSGADAEVSGGTVTMQSYNYGGAAAMRVAGGTKSNSNTHLSYLRFDTSSVSGSITNAQLVLTWGPYQNGHAPLAGTVRLYGVVDGYAGVDQSNPLNGSVNDEEDVHDESWPEGAGAGVETPGLDLLSSPALTLPYCIISSAYAPLLTTATVSGSEATGTTLTFSGTALSTFLNANTDHKVTFILDCDTPGAYNRYQLFATKEYTPPGQGLGDWAPKLILTVP